VSPKDPYVKGLVSRLGLLGSSGIFRRWESLGHWSVLLEGSSPQGLLEKNKFDPIQCAFSTDDLWV
jgi:hypothetical protein